MTLLEAPPAPPDAEAPTRRRTTHRAIAAVAVVGLVAGGIVGGLAIRDAVALSQVHVFLDAKPLTCSDPHDLTTVARGDDLDPDGEYAVPAVRGALGIDCTLAVVVANDSDQDVDVQRITLPLLGPESRVGLRADLSLTQGLRLIDGTRTADAVFDYQHRSPIGVAANGTRVFRFRLVSTGCRQAGATTTWDDAPVVTTTVGMVTQDLDRQGVPFGFAGARTDVQPCR